MADYGRWIQNDIYRNTKRRLDNLSNERRAAVERVREAKTQLDQIDVEIADRTNLDRKELDWKLAQERRRNLDSIDELTDELRLEIGRQNVRFRDRVDELRYSILQVEDGITQVDGRVNEMADDFAREFSRITNRLDDQKTRALAYSTQLRMMLDDICSLHPNKLSPGDAEDISEALTYALSDIDYGDYQAAIGVSQINLINASVLQSKLEILNDEYSQLLVHIYERCSSIHERIDSLKKPENNIYNLPFADISEEFDGRIPFWSSGLFDEIELNFRRICDAVESRYEVDMDIDSLKDALVEIVHIEEQLDECIAVAHNEYYEFLRVQQLAISLYEALTYDGSWHLHADSSGYTDADERRPYRMVLVDGCGNVASIVVFHNREIRSQTRRGVEYGETQFMLDVCDGDTMSDADLCEIIRRGLLSRLEESHIDIGRGNRQDSRISDSNSTEFITNTVIVGDKIKDDRIAAAGNHMRIKQTGR